MISSVIVSPKIRLNDELSIRYCLKVNHFEHKKVGWKEMKVDNKWHTIQWLNTVSGGRSLVSRLNPSIHLSKLFKLRILPQVTEWRLKKSPHPSTTNVVLSRWIIIYDCPAPRTNLPTLSSYRDLYRPLPHSYSFLTTQPQCRKVIHVFFQNAGLILD